MTQPLENDVPLVTAVVLSYNRPAYLRLALTALVAQTYPGVHILVVDNRSPSSAEVRKVVADFPSAEMIANDYNLGFSGGMNVGINMATGEFVCLTEDDIVLHPDYIGQLVRFHAEESVTGLMGGIQYNRETGTIRCAGGDYDLGRTFRQRFFGQGEADHGQFLRPFRVGFLPGSMMFARTELLRQLGGFRDYFFMYFEDLELCARAAKASIPITVVPQAKAYHHEPATRTNAETVDFHATKNFLATYLLHARLRVLPEFVFRYGIINTGRALFTNRRQFGNMLRAWSYIAARGISFWAQRFAIANAVTDRNEGVTPTHPHHTC